MSRTAANVLVVTIMIIGLAALAGILYYVEEPGFRLPAGLLALLPVLWALVWGARQGLTEEALTAPLHKRRYLKLRAKTQQLIDEITRLNWTMVDGRRGLRPPDEVKADADEIEARLHQIIVDIRESAGEISPDEDWH